MLDFIILYRRNPTLSREAFRSRWGDAAGIADMYAHAPGRVRARRCLVSSEPAPLPGMPMIDVSIDAFDKLAVTDEASARALLHGPEHAASWREMAGALSTMNIFSVKSHVVRDELDREPGTDRLLKRIVLVKRRPELTREQYYRHWFDIHAPLARKVQGGARLYVQHQVLGTVPAPAGIASLDLELEGFSETWYDNDRELARAAATPEGRAVAADNLTFGGQSKRFFFDEIRAIG